MLRMLCSKIINVEKYPDSPDVTASSDSPLTEEEATKTALKITITDPNGNTRDFNPNPYSQPKKLR